MDCLSVSIPIAFLWESCSIDVSHGSTEGFLPEHIEAHFFCIPPDLLAFDLIYRLPLGVTNCPLCFDDSEHKEIVLCLPITQPCLVNVQSDSALKNNGIERMGLQTKDVPVARSVNHDLHRVVERIGTDHYC
jgi:hypothetical protein